jgi:hypothetical protein
MRQKKKNTNTQIINNHTLHVASCLVLCFLSFSSVVSVSCLARSTRLRPWEHK